MTDNTQELDEIFDKLFAGHVDYMITEAEAKQSLLDWHNKQVEEVLGRLESHAALTASNKVEVVALTDIKRERNKLKESN